MTVLNNLYTFIATLSLVIQIAVLFLLVYGYSQKLKERFERHAFVMTAAVVLHLSMIFSIMIPGFVLAIFPYFVVMHFFSLISVISLIHVPLGVSAVSLGVWLVVSWRRQGLESCFLRRKFMLITITLWSATLFFGIVFYLVLYWNSLFS